MSNLLVFVIIVISVLLLLFRNHYLNRDWFTAVNLFVIYWIIIVLFNRVSKMGAFEISTKSCWIVIIGLLGFYFGSASSRHFRFIIKGWQEKRGSINTIVYRFLLVLFTFLTFYYFIRIFSFLENGYSFRMVRNIFLEYEGLSTFFNNRIEELMLHWIVIPLSMLIPPITIVLYFHNEGKKWEYFMASMGFIMYYVMSQSRFSMLFIILTFVTCLYLYKSRMEPEKLKRIVLILFICIILLSIFTAVRFVTNVRNRGINSYITYLSSPLTLMDRNIQKIDKDRFRAYGQSFVYGFIVPIKGICNMLGFQPSWVNHHLVEIENSKEIFQQVAKHQYFNAFYTVYFDFYIDFGYIGVFVGCFIFGRVAERNIIRMKNNPYDTIYVFKGIIAVYSIIMSIVRWQLVNFSFCFMLLFFLFLMFGTRIEVNLES